VPTLRRSGSSATGSPLTLREDLYEWLTVLPAWQQDLVRRLASRPQLDGDEYEQARHVVLAAYGALEDDVTAPEPAAISFDEVPGPPEPGDVTRLLAVGSLRGVGAVADDQELSFAEAGLTIVYGANAVGKTTYVRALKRVCRTVDCDAELRGNVFAAPGDAQPPPTARVEYVGQTGVRAQQIDLPEPGDTGLDALSVFDSRCAELYLDSRNTVAYVPSSLKLLARLASTQDSLRHDLDEVIEQLRREQPEFRELATPCEARTRALGLTANTNVEELRAFATLTEAERQRHTELRAAIAAADAQNAQVDADAARQDARDARTLAATLRSLSERLSATRLEQLRAAAGEASRASEAVALAASEFAQLPLPGIGADAWQRMWHAARQFIENEGGSFPPGLAQPCPLCLQPLADEAATRLEHFERHVQSALQQQALDAAARLEVALELVAERAVDDLRGGFLTGLREREEGLSNAVERFLGEMTACMARLRQDPMADVGPPAEDPRQALEDWAAARDQHAETLLAATDTARQSELRQGLAELDGRELLAARMADAEAWVKTLGRIQALQRAHSGLATNRITTKQRELSERAVTGALDQQLRQELDLLNCEHLPVDLHPQTAVGQTQVALRLAGAQGVPPVSDILSEGEQRALSLAFFFAEIGIAEHAGGIIVDDPVSSLDDERRSYIARRLVTEAAQRQVIVFTHDLPFMLDLIEQAEQKGLEPALQGVWRLGRAVGRVDDNPPFSAMKFRQRTNVLTERVSQWDNQPDPRDADEAWRRVCDFYADMRTTWERAVEERLFRGVVQRFQREVKTLKLREVEVTDDLVSVIEEGMTRCSLFVHDAPVGTRTSLPGRTRLAQDVEKLREFERASRPS
jgi:energy-coupling factor transporter ATP-binding protein EcfA2